jgi:3-dehydroquinate dehydratase / shikimate dehydrogenase
MPLLPDAAISRMAAHANVSMNKKSVAASVPDSGRALLCTSITADSVQSALDMIVLANGSGADIVELRLDFYKNFQPQKHLKQLMEACRLPFIVTYRPEWEGCATSHSNFPDPIPCSKGTLIPLT